MDDAKQQFSLIYDQYIDKIYRFIYLKVNAQEVAEDSTSKVFLKGWESFHKNQEVKNVNAFLYRIARNSVIDYYREKGRTKVINFGQKEPDLRDAKVNLYEQMAVASDFEIVKVAIGNLKKEYQDIIILHYLEDMSSSQISEIINRPEGTVRVMVHRGLKALKDQLL